MISIKAILIMACIVIIGVVAHGPRDDKRRPWDPSMTRPPKPTLAPGETYPPRRGRGGHDSHDKDFTRPTLAPGETYPPRWRGSRDRDFHKGHRKGKPTAGPDETLLPLAHRGGGGRIKFTLPPGETYPPRRHPPFRGGGGGRDKFTRDKDFTKPTLAPGETYPPRGGPHVGPRGGPPHRG